MTFPRLRTGVTAQYPVERKDSWSTEIVTFVDGTEQRCSLYARPIQQWVVRLTLLDESELAALDLFFEQQGGESNGFTFVDPLDGVVYENCHFEGGRRSTRLTGPGRGGTDLVIRRG